MKEVGEIPRRESRELKFSTLFGDIDTVSDGIVERGNSMGVEAVIVELDDVEAAVAIVEFDRVVIVMGEDELRGVEDDDVKDRFDDEAEDEEELAIFFATLVSMSLYISVYNPLSLSLLPP